MKSDRFNQPKTKTILSRFYTSGRIHFTSESTPFVWYFQSVCLSHILFVRSILERRRMFTFYAEITTYTCERWSNFYITWTIKSD